MPFIPGDPLHVDEHNRLTATDLWVLSGDVEASA